MTPQELEKEIITLLKKGNERAMAPIFKLYHRSLSYFARQLVDNDGQAEDIVADAFVKVWQKNNDFESLASIRSFMYVTIRNSCCNYLRHIQRKTASHKEILHLARKDEDYIESKMIKADLLHIILQEVESLPPIRRKIFKMIYLDDLSIFEIATKLNISVDTVRVQKARALHGLRTAILKKGILLTVAHLTAGLSFFKL
ncbi:MAG: RNA polymerase sigma-70 factor [Bacteroidota bacterium]